MTVVKTGYRITGPYRWDAVATRAYAVRTSSVPAGSFRGFGGTQASFASESQIDMIARRLGIDRISSAGGTCSPSARRSGRATVAWTAISWPGSTKSSCGWAT